MKNIQFIMISYEELVSLLIMCGYSYGIVGTQVKEFTLSREDQIKYAESNRQKLIDSGFLMIDEDGKMSMDEDIAHLLHVLMDHQLAYIMIRTFPELDRQEQVVYEICGKDILEHYAYSNGMHRFSILPEPEDLYERIRELIPVTDYREEQPEVFTISENRFKEVIDQVKSGITDAPRNTLTGTGMSAGLAENCIDGIKSPEVSISIMGIIFEDQLAIKVSSISVFVNNNALWGVWPVENKAVLEDGQANDEIAVEGKEVAVFECIQSDIVFFFKHWIDVLYEEEKAE